MVELINMITIVVLIFCSTAMLVLAVGAFMTWHTGKTITCRNCGTKNYAGKVCYCQYEEHI